MGPTGTVIYLFVFADVERSSRQSGAATEVLVASHNKLICSVVGGHDGSVFTAMGDGFAIAFHRVLKAVAAAVGLQESFTIEQPDRLKV